MMSQQIGEFMTKCANIPYKDYSWLKDHCYRTLNRPCSPNARNEHLAVLDLIKEHEERYWIPVSERLPEESDYVLCCDKDGYMTIGYVSKYSKEWCFDDDEIDIDVVAWMTLPEPYKAESGDKG